MMGFENEVRGHHTTPATGQKVEVVVIRLVELIVQPGAKNGVGEMGVPGD
jgi:hypothetical protein